MELKKLLLLLIFASPLRSCAQQIISPQQTEKFSAELSKKVINKVVRTVADWQIDNFHSVKHHKLDWTNGALYIVVADKTTKSIDVY